MMMITSTTTTTNVDTRSRRSTRRARKENDDKDEDERKTSTEPIAAEARGAKGHGTIMKNEHRDDTSKTTNGGLKAAAN